MPVDPIVVHHVFFHGQKLFPDFRSSFVFSFFTQIFYSRGYVEMFSGRIIWSHPNPSENFTINILYPKKTHNKHIPRCQRGFRNNLLVDSCKFCLLNVVGQLLCLSGARAFWRLCLVGEDFHCASLCIGGLKVVRMDPSILECGKDDEGPRCHEAFSWIFSVYVQSICLCGVRASWRLCFEVFGNAGHSL